MGLSQLLSTAMQDLFHPNSDWNVPNIDELLSHVPLPGDLDDHLPATKQVHTGGDELVCLPVSDVNQSAKNDPDDAASNGRQSSS